MAWLVLKRPACCGFQRATIPTNPGISYPQGILEILRILTAYKKDQKTVLFETCSKYKTLTVFQSLSTRHNVNISMTSIVILH